MQITLLCCGPRTESRPERLLSINTGQFHDFACTSQCSSINRIISNCRIIAITIILKLHCLLSCRHCAGLLMCVLLFNTHNNPEMGTVGLSSPFYLWQIEVKKPALDYRVAPAHLVFLLFPQHAGSTLSRTFFGSSADGFFNVQIRTKMLPAHRSLFHPTQSSTAYTSSIQ